MCSNIAQAHILGNEWRRRERLARRTPGGERTSHSPAAKLNTLMGRTRWQWDQDLAPERLARGVEDPAIDDDEWKRMRSLIGD